LLFDDYLKHWAVVVSTPVSPLAFAICALVECAARFVTLAKMGNVFVEAAVAGFSAAL